ncbi:hypothetical protein NKW45_11345 [Acetobacter orientalis]|uniref:hypothetical protein n=1 Tax=Acetobacter orientalis TaxID=146474 RepID=UPI0020A60DE6|nr:hypothetical protein [Acetobacter orientalis]MCP1222438.1 hypothetical protein [Acetobacter orientalis]
MPMLPVSLPSVWSVPVAAGVPALLGQSVANGVRAAASVTLGSVLEDALITNAAGQWGIFSASGQCVLSAAHVVSVEAESHYHIATAPLEDGGFVSYSKVATPRTHRVQMVCDGSEVGLGSSLTGVFMPPELTERGCAGALYVRKAFFETLSQIEADLALYAVLTPERKYSAVNVTGHRWLRNARHGITMPVVEITLQEVRLAPTPLYTNTRQPQGQAVVCGGMVPAQSGANSTAQNSLSGSVNNTSWASMGAGVL